MVVLVVMVVVVIMLLVCMAVMIVIVLYKIPQYYTNFMHACFWMIHNNVFLVMLLMVGVVLLVRLVFLKI